MRRPHSSLLVALLAACSTTAATSTDTDTGPLPYAEDTCTGPAEAPWISVTVGANLACAVASGGCARCWGSDRPGSTDSGGHGASSLDYVQPEPTVKFESVHLFKGGSGLPVVIGVDPLGFPHLWNDFRVSPRPIQFSSFTAGVDYSCGADLHGESACVHGSNDSGFPWGEPIGKIQFWRMAQGLEGVLDLDGTIWLHPARGVQLAPGSPPNRVGSYVNFDVASVQSTAVCALDTAGKLSCWNPSDDPTDAPALTGVPEGTFTDVCVTEHGSACALDESGYPVCWGEIDDEPAEALKAIACGSTSVCGITLDGQLRCWGACEFGECDAPE